MEPGRRKRGCEVIASQIVDEQHLIAAERRTLLKDAILLAAIAIAITAFLLVWRAEITGMVTADPQDRYCDGFGDLVFLSDASVVLERDNDFTHQLKLICLPGEVTFHDNSDYIRVFDDGRIVLSEEAQRPGYYEAFIIAEHGSGEFIGKKFRFDVRGS